MEYFNKPLDITVKNSVLIYMCSEAYFSDPMALVQLIVNRLPNAPIEDQPWLKDCMSSALAQEPLDTVQQEDEEEQIKIIDFDGHLYRLDKETHDVYALNEDVELGIYIESEETVDFFEEY